MAFTRIGAAVLRPLECQSRVNSRAFPSLASKAFMHELSIAINILDIVGEEADRYSEGRIAAIHLKLGPLSGVAKEALMSAFELAREGTVMPACELIIEDSPLIAFCPLCGINREIHSPQYLCCPVCDTPTPDVVSGREMDIVAMEVCA
jgi:hydrogenase nickel incorporation protein HypA/HybF